MNYKFKKFMQENYPSITDDSKEWKMMEKTWTEAQVSLDSKIEDFKDCKLGDFLTESGGRDWMFVSCICDKVLVVVSCSPSDLREYDNDPLKILSEYGASTFDNNRIAKCRLTIKPKEEVANV